MHIRTLTALTALAAMGALAGCGGEDGGYEPADETAYEQEEAAPAPESSTTRPAEETGGEMAGTEEDPMGQQTQEPFGDEPTGTDTADTGEQTTTTTTTTGDEMETTGQQDVGTTEFAALDTNSDGELSESEWQPDAVQGKEFQEIDEDGDGTIDREEFQQATDASAESGQSETEPMP